MRKKYYMLWLLPIIMFGFAYNNAMAETGSCPVAGDAITCLDGETAICSVNNTYNCDSSGVCSAITEVITCPDGSFTACESGGTYNCNLTDCIPGETITCPNGTEVVCDTDGNYACPVTSIESAKFYIASITCTDKKLDDDKCVLAEGAVVPTFAFSSTERDITFSFEEGPTHRLPLMVEGGVFRVEPGNRLTPLDRLLYFSFLEELPDGRIRNFMAGFSPPIGTKTPGIFDHQGNHHYTYLLRFVEPVQFSVHASSGDIDNSDPRNPTAEFKLGFTVRGFDLDTLSVTFIGAKACDDPTLLTPDEQALCSKLEDVEAISFKQAKLLERQLDPTGGLQLNNDCENDPCDCQLCLAE